MLNGSVYVDETLPSPERSWTRLQVCFSVMNLKRRALFRELVKATIGFERLLGSGGLRGRILEADGHALADRRRRLLNRL